MKLRTKSIITLVTMLLGGIGQVAAGDTQQWPPKTTTIIQLDGSNNTAAGTLTINIGEPSVKDGKAISTVTLTATPATGNYITAENISVLRTIDGSLAQTREPGIDNTPITLTAVNSDADPSGETVYTFEIEGEKINAQTRGIYWDDPNKDYDQYFFPYDYEITANFQSRKSIETAVITLQKDSYTYTGEAIEPEFTVKLGETELTKTTDYTVEFTNNTSPAKANAETNAPTITLTGVRTYKGTAKKTFTIDKIVTTLKYSAETAEATMGKEFTAPTLTVTPEGLEGIKYSSSNTSAATIAEDGKITLVGAGETIIKASFEGNEIYEAAEASYTLTISKDKATLKYSAETAEATMGAEFEAPTLTISPEGLTGITYTSSNTDAATISAEGKVTLVGKGETKITASFAGNEIYEAAEASYTLTIKQVKTELKYSTDKVTVAMGAEFEAPTLTVSPEGLTGITYTSSNTNAATISAEGVVTIVGEGETVIKASFVGNETYEAAEASYTLTVEKGVGDGFALWIGETQVTKDNKEHILGEGNLTFTFNDETKTLLITNNEDETIVIESRMPLLNVYLNGDKENKLKAIFYNNLGDVNNKGNLYITCYNNTKTPSNVTIKNDAGKSVIYGFEEVKYNTDAKLSFVEPEKTKYSYTEGQMIKTLTNDDGTTTTSVADELSIAQLLTPIDATVSFDVRNMQVMDKDGNPQYNEDGSPKLVNTDNAIVSDVLITLSNNNGTTINGFSDATEDGDNRSGLVIETENMTDAFVQSIAANVLNDVYTPGDNDFANTGYIGLTILLPAGYGNILTELNADPGYDFHILIAETTASRPNVLDKGKIYTPFNVEETTYCYIYLVKNNYAGTRLGKREKVHGKVYSVGVSVSKARSVNPPSEASGGALPASEDPKVNETTTPTPPTGITSVNSERQTLKSGWYTLDGQKIAEPKQRGLYIKDGKKVAIK